MAFFLPIGRLIHVTPMSDELCASNRGLTEIGRQVQLVAPGYGADNFPQAPS
jgi:hypothetical protein